MMPLRFRPIDILNYPSPEVLLRFDHAICFYEALSPPVPQNPAALFLKKESRGRQPIKACGTHKPTINSTTVPVKCSGSCETKDSSLQQVTPARRTWPSPHLSVGKHLRDGGTGWPGVAHPQTLPFPGIHGTGIDTSSLKMFPELGTLAADSGLALSGLRAWIFEEMEL
jgi:hypothetical protein